MVDPELVAPNDASILDDGDDPPPGSIYWKIAPPLRRTIAKSFRQRIAGAADCSKALDNAFWGGSPTTPWEALDHIGDTELNVLCVVFERLMAKVPALWSHVKCIENLWYGGSCGFRCVYDDRRATEALLATSKTAARDRPHGAAEHQDPSRGFLRRIFTDADCHCWRELGCTGTEGFHVCIATSDHRFDNIHFDWMDPADGETDDGFCTYDASVSIPHWLQAMAGVAVPLSPFRDLDARRNRVAALRSRAASAMNAPPDVAPLLDRAQQTLGVIEPQWMADRRGLAVTGLVGRAGAQGYVARVKRQIDDVLDAAEQAIDSRQGK